MKKLKVIKLVLIQAVIFILLLSCRKVDKNVVKNVKANDDSDYTINLDALKKNGLFSNAKKIILKCKEFDIVIAKNTKDENNITYNKVEIIKNEDNKSTPVESLGNTNGEIFGDLLLFLYENYVFFQVHSEVNGNDSADKDYLYYLDTKECKVIKVDVDKSEITSSGLIRKDEVILDEKVHYTLDNVIGVESLGKQITSSDKKVSSQSTGELTVIYRIAQIRNNDSLKFIMKPYSYTRNE